MIRPPAVSGMLPTTVAPPPFAQPPVIGWVPAGQIAKRDTTLLVDESTFQTQARGTALSRAWSSVPEVSSAALVVFAWWAAGCVAWSAIAWSTSDLETPPPPPESQPAARRLAARRRFF